MKTSEPIPAAISPGSSTTESIGPPRPTASMMITAPITGDPKTDAIAAKLPAAAIRLNACCDASRWISDIERMPSPVPMAINGPSGPSTSPRPSVASAASRTPGRSIGPSGVPPAFSPSAGTCPPWPGSRTIANAVSSPASASQGNGHQSGTCS